MDLTLERRIAEAIQKGIENRSPEEAMRIDLRIKLKSTYYLSRLREREIEAFRQLNQAAYKG